MMAVTQCYRLGVGWGANHGMGISFFVCSALDQCDEGGGSNQGK